MANRIDPVSGVTIEKRHKVTVVGSGNWYVAMPSSFPPTARAARAARAAHEGAGESP